ncbi:MAG TPA: ABC transporter permease [Terracidiphilus sp.]|nr:ABC transporter permease [Terracidiphilus sp.]
MSLWTRVQNLWQRKRLDEEIEAELAAHIELSVEDLTRGGMSEAEARRTARVRFGNPGVMKERVTSADAVLGLDVWWHDVHYAVRSLWRAPLLTVVAIAALSAGIGLNAGMFTLLNTLFLTPPTEKDPASFVQLYPLYEGWFTGAGQFPIFTTPDYEAIRAHAHSLAGVAAWYRTSTFLNGGNQRLDAFMVSCNYPEIFGMGAPQLGRYLRPDECKPGSEVQVAVLSDAIWRNDFGANPQMLGQTIRLNGLPLVVVGVMHPAISPFLPSGVMMPYTLQPRLEHGQNLLTSTGTPWLSMAGRLADGATGRTAQAELTTIMQQQDRTYKAHDTKAVDRKTNVALTDGSFIENPRVKDKVAGLMALILGPLSLVLLLACCNVAMLFLSRTVLRRGEIAVRLALGVSRARLARMLLVESLLMTGVAGLISLPLAYVVPELVLQAMGAEDGPPQVVSHPDWHVFGFLAAMIVLATIAASLAPMHAAWKLDLLSALKGREGAATMRSRMTNSLIVAQVAMSFVLIAAAVLFVRLPSIVRNMDAGFETRHLLEMSLDVDRSTPESRAKALILYRSVEERLRALPGVESMGYGTVTPYRLTPASSVRIGDDTATEGKPAVVNEVSLDLMKAVGASLEKGRFFAAGDVRGNAVAVISHAFAAQYFPGIDPIGRKIVAPDGKRLTVVGVAADLRSQQFGMADGPRLYTLQGADERDGNLYVRFSGDPKAMERAVKSAVMAVDPTQTPWLTTVWEDMERTAESFESLARIVVVMATIAMLLAVTGVYAVLSFVVSQRSREYGIRMVMGADRRAIFRAVLLRSSVKVGIGLALGLALAEPGMWIFKQVVANSPVPIRVFDPMLLGSSALILGLVAFAAMYVPAMRATKVDPMRALRME